MVEKGPSFVDVEQSTVVVRSFVLDVKLPSILEKACADSETVRVF